MTPSLSLLKLSQVRKAYGDFDLDVTMDVEPGTFVSIVGPSGSGKTTTLRIIAGFEKIDSGRVEFNGMDIADKKPWKRNFGFVPQDLVLFPHLPVAGNIAYGLRARRWSDSRSKAKVEELLQLVGLAGYGARRIDTLSGGEQQRVAIARSLAIDPSILLLDEPFSALDAPLRREMRGEVQSIQETTGISVVFVTHNQDEALSVSDKVVLMHEGSVVQSGTPEELYNSPVNKFAAEFVGAANTFPVEVTGVSGADVTLKGAHGEFVVLADEPASSGPCLLLVRPHCFFFSGANAANAVQGVIRRRRFLGDRYEYVCSSGTEEVVVVDDERRSPAESVYLSFEPSDGILLR